MPKIIETASAAHSFKTLMTAVKAAGLVETLSGRGPFTLFAPNDEAFAKLPKSSVDDLLEDIPRLKQLLTYHIVPGKVTASEVMKYPSAETLEGQHLGLISNNGIKVNEAKVIRADIKCDNGVIHMIDTVLTLPTAKSTTP
jgi:uncharacterized surface protein with fasciclin (FAS1) repeats